MIYVKKITLTILFVAISVSLSGAGYKGDLPDLDFSPVQVQEPKPLPQNDILPLDKLTIPVQQPVKVDKVLEKYNNDMSDVIRQLERLDEILVGDKSFKNYIAAANVLDLTTHNILSQYKEPRFYPANRVLEDINYDVQQIKDYWVKVTKNAPYVTYYETQGSYSGSVLNEQLNNFANVLEYAIRDLKKKLGIKDNL